MVGEKSQKAQRIRDYIHKILKLIKQIVIMVKIGIGLYVATVTIE